MALDSGRYANAPALLKDLSDHTVRLLTDRLQTSPELAASVAQELVDHMRQNWGGLAFYFPKGCTIDEAEAKARIVDEFTGSNHAILAKRYGLSVNRIYQILRAERSRRR